MYKNELYHHGVLGQKWGVRRFQNYDGTLTARGKKRELKTAGQYKRALNKIERGISEENISGVQHVETRDAQLKARNSKLRKAAEEYSTKGETKRYKKLTAAIDRHNKFIDEEQKGAQEHLNNMKKGRELTDKLIKEAKSKGFDVTTKNRKVAIHDARVFVNTLYLMDQPYYKVTKASET